MAAAVNAARQLRAAPRALAKTEQSTPEVPKVVIGARWTRGMHSVRREPNTELGTYEEVNSQVTSQTEEFVQRALLARVTDPASLQRIEAARTARLVTPGTSQ